MKVNRQMIRRGDADAARDFIRPVCAGKSSPNADSAGTGLKLLFRLNLCNLNFYATFPDGVGAMESSARHAGLFVVERPAGNQAPHTHGVVTRSLAMAFIHVELMSLFNLGAVGLNA